MQMAPMRNKYVVGTHISERKFREIVRLFCKDCLATYTAEQTGISRPTINKYYDAFRRLIADLSERSEELGQEEILAQLQSPHGLFDMSKLRDCLGWVTNGDTPILGFLKGDGTVYTQLLENTTLGEWVHDVIAKAEKEGQALAEGLAAYRHDVSDYLQKQCDRLSQYECLTQGRAAVAEIEHFWGVCKTRLTKFRGLKEERFYLYIKECEFRYNMRNSDMYQFLLKAMREEPIELAAD